MATKKRPAKTRTKVKTKPGVSASKKAPAVRAAQQGLSFVRKQAKKEEENRIKAARRQRDRRIAKARKNLNGKAKEKEIAVARRICEREKERAANARRREVEHKREVEKRAKLRRVEGEKRAQAHAPKKLRADVVEGKAPRKKTTFGVSGDVKKTKLGEWKDTEHGKVPARKAGIIETPIAALLRAWVPISVVDQPYQLDEIRALLDKGEPLEAPSVLCDKKGNIQVLSGAHTLAVARERGLSHVPVRWSSSSTILKPDSLYTPLEGLGTLPSVIRKETPKAEIEIPKGWFNGSDRVLADIKKSLSSLEEYINKTWEEISTTNWVVPNPDGTIDGMLRCRIPFVQEEPFDFWDKDGMMDFFGLSSENFQTIRDGFFKIDLTFGEVFETGDPDILEALAEKYKAQGYPHKKGSSEGGLLGEIFTYWIESPRAGEMFFTAQEIASRLWDKDKFVVEVDFRYFWSHDDLKAPRNRLEAKRLTVSRSRWKDDNRTNSKSTRTPQIFHMGS